MEKYKSLSASFQADFEKNWKGRKLMVVGNHPHAGLKAEVIDIDKTHAGVGFICQSDNGELFFIFHKYHLKWL